MADKPKSNYRLPGSSLHDNKKQGNSRNDGRTPQSVPGKIYRGVFNESEARPYKTRQYSHTATVKNRPVKYFHCWINDPDTVKAPEMKTPRAVIEVDKAVKARKSLWDRLFGETED